MITLNWRIREVLGKDYYYTFYKEKFWCVGADNVRQGIIKDTEFIFQVTDNSLDENTKNDLLQRMAHLFPELDLDKIKKALLSEKDVDC